MTTAAPNPLRRSRRAIIKIGSALLVDQASGKINRSWLDAIAGDIDALRQACTQILIVSSGAIALGRARLGLKKGPLSLAEKQAAAAAGQAILTQQYEQALSPYGYVTAQALLTLEDTENRRRWLNGRATLEALLAEGAVPIINENDTVATDEIRYGDNDRLAARVAQMMGADCLILLSDIDGLYDKDPRCDPNAQHIPFIEEINAEILAMGSGANPDAAMGSGGMATKLIAAQIATAAGCHVAIVKGNQDGPLAKLAAGETQASWFKASGSPQSARKAWIAGSLRPKGTITIDDGAAKALRGGSSLLAAGALACTGNFEKGDAVDICLKNEQIIARGLIGLAANHVRDVLGRKSADMAPILGYDVALPVGGALMHRDNMVLFE